MQTRFPCSFTTLNILIKFKKTLRWILQKEIGRFLAFRLDLPSSYISYIIQETCSANSNSFQETRDSVTVFISSFGAKGH